MKNSITEHRSNHTSVFVWYPIAVLLLIMATACTNKNEELTTKGVSLELATGRKGNIDAVSYDLSLNLPKEITQKIAGIQTLNFSLKDNSRPLYIDFHETKDHIQSVSVNGVKVTTDFVDEHIVIQGNSLQVGSNNVKVVFTAGEAPLIRKEEYFYTLLVPEKARKFFPCFDQPDLKAVFKLTVVAPADWEVISNAPLADSAITEGTKTMHFEKSDKISTYLFSIVAGKFSVASRTIDGRKMNFYYRETNKEKIEESLDTIFKLHGASINYMEQYTGIKYPFKKFDFIALPGFPYGGMEHVGAIDYSESALFLDKTAGGREKVSRAQVIAHETSHMWFGNLVTMKSFNDVWMKEVFANFLADKIVSSIVPQYDPGFSFMMEHHPLAYYVDRTPGSNPIRQHLDNLNNAGSLYGNIIYDKAPIVMNQLEITVGKDVLKKGLQSYLAKYSGSNADWPDLIAILNAMSGKDMTAWNDNWINKAGRPNIEYTLQKKGTAIGGLRVRQVDPSNTGRLWNQYFTIALVYSGHIELIPVALEGGTVDVKEARGLPIPDQIIFNATGEGYGLFPADDSMFGFTGRVEKDVVRASSYLNLYENVLEGRTMTPEKFIAFYGKKFGTEQNDILLSRMGRQFKNIYWQFLTPEQREAIGLKAESDIQAAIAAAKTDTKRRSLFKIYAAIAISNSAIEKLYGYWKQKKGPNAIVLNDDELSGLAAELALRGHPETESILSTQVTNIRNPDSKVEFQFLRASLSNKVATRDAFFASLANERKNENYIATALSYLHHPLRSADSEKYLPKTLELLSEVKAKGGIFFPSDWLSNSFGLYQSEHAAKLVSKFLKDHPRYDQNLKFKILQETDDLFRSRKLIRQGR